jgi:hypothetical protein
MTRCKRGGAWLLFLAPRGRVAHWGLPRRPYGLGHPSGLAHTIGGFRKGCAGSLAKKRFRELGLFV